MNDKQFKKLKNKVAAEEKRRAALVAKRKQEKQAKFLAELEKAAKNLTPEQRAYLEEYSRNNEKFAKQLENCTKIDPEIWRRKIDI